MQKTIALCGAPNAASAQRGRWALGRTLVAASLGLFALLVAERALAYCRLTTDQPMAGQSCAQSGIPLAWHRQCISYSVKDPGPSLPALTQIRDTADVCFKTWTAVTCNGQTLGLKLAQTLELAECDVPEYNPHGPNANTVAFISNWSQYESASADAFGLTLVWHNPDTGEIYDADIQLNETLGPITICGASCPAGAVDLQNVLTHEAGHFLGLGHSNVLNATMSARATIGETSKRDLAPDDKQALCAAYGSLSAASCSDQDFVPNHGFSPSCAAADGSSSSSSTHHSVLCSAAPIGAGSGPGLAWFGLALASLYLAARRARTGRSSASPKPR